MTEPGGTAAVASDGNWWQRRRTWQKVLIILGAVFVALAVLGAAFGDPQASEGPAAAGDEAAETTTTEAGLPGIGDAVHDGKFEFFVTSIEQPGTVYQPPGGLKDEANGR